MVINRALGQQSGNVFIVGSGGFTGVVSWLMTGFIAITEPSCLDFNLNSSSPGADKEARGVACSKTW